MRHVLDLQKIMAESRDYDELLFAWNGWRESAGKVLRGDYERYVELANKAATLNGTRPGGRRRVSPRVRPAPSSLANPDYHPQATATTEPSGAPCTRRPHLRRTWRPCGGSWSRSTSTCMPTFAGLSTKSTAGNGSTSRDPFQPTCWVSEGTEAHVRC